ncbi:methyltransferase domain-containing protein [Synechocystis salina LEGE 06099]|uniref:class I SAM-dependent methyltransferase n=1 Tax=Synechocystis salina TaxID=945780 RepID=UPI00188120AA|nr:class I SAM-dependent methyltransferase [Synechocystis salina]MBE9202520.1 methyltransferase domain-containing protein [Synechocystis salina LEGE 06099]
MSESFDLSYRDKSLQQFESYPYPGIPIEEPLNQDIGELYKNCLVTSHYCRDKRVITDLENRAILDVACGTGATTLRLAWANPGTKIVGIDMSPESIKIAEQRLKYHGFHDAEFHVLAIEDLQQLEQKFDLINASDVLYLLPDLALTLKQLAQVLKSDGIIRGNLHSYYQRHNYYRAQTLFQKMGLMEDNPEETELNLVREFYDALKDGVDLKMKTWRYNDSSKVADQLILMNHLFQNDKGYTLSQLFDAFQQSGLQLVDMVDWRYWDWKNLFKQPDNLPAYLVMGLEGSSLEEQLCFYELVQPDKRLLDFWCGHARKDKDDGEIDRDWQEQNPEKVIVHLHPCLHTEKFREAILESNAVAPVNLKQFFPFLDRDAWVDHTLLCCLGGPLLDSPRSLQFLWERWRQLRPLDPADFCAVDEGKLLDLLKLAIFEQESLGVLLVEVVD